MATPLTSRALNVDDTVSSRFTSFMRPGAKDQQRRMSRALNADDTVSSRFASFVRLGAKDQHRRQRAATTPAEYLSAPNQSEQISTVDLFKPEGDAPLGLSLAKPLAGASRGGEGAIIAAVLPGSPASRCKRLQAGDLLLAVNGVPVVSFQHACDVLRAAPTGTVLQLVLSIAPAALPEGWQRMTDGNGVPCYVHDELRLKTYSHPRCCPTDAGAAPRKGAEPGARWRAAYLTIRVVNALTAVDSVRWANEEDQSAGLVETVQPLQHARV